MVVWIIGLAGSGKSAIGRATHELWKRKNPAVVLLDGDTLRHVMGDDLGHTLADRETNGWRMCRLCLELDKQDIDVICCILSLFPEQRAWNRQHYSSYLEVAIDVSMETLRARDQKGLYSGAARGEISDVAGVDLPYPVPNADLVLENTAPTDDFGPFAEAIIAAAEAAR